MYIRNVTFDVFCESADAISEDQKGKKQNKKKAQEHASQSEKKF